MKNVPLSEVKDDLSKYLRAAEKQALVITRHGKPAGVLIGFASEEDWFEYRLLNDPRFLKRIADARRRLTNGKGVRIEDIDSPRVKSGAGCFSPGLTLSEGFAAVLTDGAPAFRLPCVPLITGPPWPTSVRAVFLLPP